jgi:hypothetical protein
MELVLGTLVVPFIMRRSRKRLGILVFLAAVIATAWMSGCGGGSSGGTTGPTTHNVAPGTYKLTLTSKSGQASATEVLTLVVQ